LEQVLKRAAEGVVKDALRAPPKAVAIVRSKNDCSSNELWRSLTTPSAGAHGPLFQTMAACASRFNKSGAISLESSPL
jgi:hypothetical protein